MPTRPARVASLLAALLAVACCSCVPKFKHALADEKTSRIDERLIDNWYELEERDDKLVPAMWLAIGKKVGEERVLEAVSAEIGEKSEVKIVRMPIYCTTIGNDHFLSMLDLEEGSLSYAIFKYELPDADTLHIYSLDETVIRDAVKNGHLTGKYNKGRGFYIENGKAEYEAESYEVTASPDELRKYLETVGDKCFYKDAPPLKLTRAK